MSDHVEIAVIGAGVVGLAVGRALALAGREVLVLEGATAIGTGVSSRNSEVIHAGIYYPAGSLKAKLCVSGREWLYAYCEARGVPHARLGKIIVAAEAGELPVLDKYLATARTNGVTDLVKLSAAQANAMEPAVRATGALHSPSTGVIDSHALMLAYEGDLEARGGSVVLRSPVLGGTVKADGVTLEIGGSTPSELHAALVVNCAGLSAPAVARSLAGFPPAQVPREYFARGHYFTLAGASPFRRLVYPVPEPGGLGVHVTLDLAGRARFGPDVDWIPNVDYSFDVSRRARFAAAIRRYYPALDESKLEAGYTGIRPKISGPDEAAADFVIAGARDHGEQRVINLFGIESPGLTSSLAIAQLVAKLAAEQAG